MAGIRSEVRILKEFLEPNLENMKAYAGIVKQKGMVSKLRFTGEYRLLFVERNLEKMGVLDESLLADIIALRSIVAIFPDNMRFLEDTISRSSQGIESIEALLTQIALTINTCKRMLKLSDRIIGSA